MTDFTQFSPEQIVTYVDQHSHLFASEFDEEFPANLAGVSGPLWATIRRKEGFAIVFKGVSPLLGYDGANANLMFVYVLPEFAGKGLGTEIIEEAKAAVPSRRPIDVTCEGRARMDFFERCGFTLLEHDIEADLYHMQWTPATHRVKS
jgi:GNAT superfamily N-acetyltransferase